MTAKTYLKLAQGKLDGRVAFMLGKIKIKGDRASLATVRECFRIPEL
jgi:putative sterol carrier protein